MRRARGARARIQKEGDLGSVLVPQPEQEARKGIDRLLTAAGWLVCDADQANIHGARGVAIREFPLPGHGFADYLLYIDGKAAGVIEARKEGITLTGVEVQSTKYTQGLPEGLPCWANPLPFSYQSTGIETRFTNGLDPAPRSRPVFAFHKPETLASWLADLSLTITVRPWIKVSDYADATGVLNWALLKTFRARGFEIPFPQDEVQMVEGNFR